jgi:hypothetical protein
LGDGKQMIVSIYQTAGFCDFSFNPENMVQ